MGSLDIESDRNGHLGDIKEASVFSVLFEVHPMSEQRDNYLGYARMLRPELETVDGFVDNIRYRSLTRVDSVALRLARREVPRPLAR